MVRKEEGSKKTGLMPDGCQLTKDLRRGYIRSDNEVYSWHVLMFR